MTGKPGLLLCSERVEHLLDAALADRFDVLPLWQARDPGTVISQRGTDVVVALTTHMDTVLMDCLPNLRLIVVPGAGYEGIDVAATHERGISVSNAGSAHSTEVADHAVALILASVHRLPDMDELVRTGRWRETTQSMYRQGMSVQRFGIVGIGNVGNAVAERLAPFGGRIAAWSPNSKSNRWPRRESLLDLARWCTALIVTTRGDATGLIDAKTINCVGPDGLIVNVSRGAVIDEDALISALKEGRLGRAALDVFVDEPTAPDRWHNVPNTILSPHVAGVSREAIAHLRDAVRRNLMSVLDDSPLVNEITP